MGAATDVSCDSGIPAVVVAIVAPTGSTAEKILRALAAGRQRPSDAIRASAERQQWAREKLFDLAVALENASPRRVRHFAPEWIRHANGNLVCMGTIVDKKDGMAVNVMLVLGEMEDAVIAIVDDNFRQATKVSLKDGLVKVRVGNALSAQHINNLADQIAVRALQIGSSVHDRTTSSDSDPRKHSGTQPDFRTARQERVRAEVFGSGVQPCPS